MSPTIFLTGSAQVARVQFYVYNLCIGSICNNGTTIMQETLIRTVTHNTLSR